jgi:phage baseplate assembly protein W
MTESAPGYPFEPNAGGVWPMAEDDDLCRQEIEQAVLTAPGEMPIEKSLGSQFARVLFSLDSDVQAAAARRYAEEAIRKMVGRVVVVDAKVENDAEGSSTVTIEYQRVTSDTPGTVSFPVGVRT